MKRRNLVPLLVVIMLLKASHAHAQRLDDIVDIVRFAWSNSDAKAVAAMGASDGISIETRNGRMGPLRTRQVNAVLRRLFEERETVSIHPGRTQIVGGSPRRAFSEITWVTRAPDTTEPERITILLELVQEGERWRITQIRMLP